MASKNVETKGTVNPAPAKEKKNMAKETTPATTPAESKTRKPAEQKNRKNTSKAPADKDKNAKKFSINVEKNTADIVKVSATVGADIVNGELVLTHGAKANAVTINLPKTTKADQRENFGKLVQGKVFDYIAEDSTSKIKTIDDKVSKSESGEPTADQQNKLDAYKDQRTMIGNLRKSYKVGGANLVTDKLAQLVACKVVGHKLPIETSILQNCLQANYKALHDFSVKGVKDGKAEMTDEQKTSVDALKKALVETMSVFCTDTTWCNSFKLKASGEDAVLFYELCLVKLLDGEPIFLWTNDKKGERMKELDNALCEWLFRKMKIDIE